MSEAPSCRLALTEATHLWPNRSKLSDGILPSAAHTIQNPTSDHELGNAWDLTHDPENGCDAHMLAEFLKLTKDPRVKYIISNRRIWNPLISDAWRYYGGSNPHSRHIHVSIHPWARGQLMPWFQIQLVVQGEAPGMAIIKIYSPIKDVTYFVDPMTGKPHGYAFVAENGATYGWGSADGLFKDEVQVLPAPTA